MPELLIITKRLFTPGWWGSNSVSLQDRQQHGAFGEIGLLHAWLPHTRRPMVRAQNLDHSNLVAALEFRTAQAVFPGFQRQLAAFHFLKAHLAKKIRDIREGEDGVKRKQARLVHERLHHAPADAVRLPAWVKGERAHFADNGTV